MRYYTAARAVRPETAHELAHLLERHGPSRRGEAVFRDLVGRRPDDARHLGCYGEPPDGPRSAGGGAGPRAGRRRLPRGDPAASPTTPRPTTTSASPWATRAKLRRGGRRVSARRSGSSPTTPRPTTTSASPCERQGKLDEAVAAYREAIRLKPDHAEAHDNLGIALQRPGEAGRGGRRVPRGDPAQARRRRGPLQPRHRPAATRGSWTRRSPSTARRSGSSPTTPRPTATSASPCESQGDYAEALAEFRRGTSSARSGPAGGTPRREWVARGRAAGRAGRPAAGPAQGRRPPHGQRRAPGLRPDVLRHEALRRRRPALGRGAGGRPEARRRPPGQHRYNAACAAALAAAGQGKDDPPPDDAARAKLRGQALDWLKAERAAWAKLLDAATPRRGPVLPTSFKTGRSTLSWRASVTRPRWPSSPMQNASCGAALWTRCHALHKRAAGGAP